MLLLIDIGNTRIKWARADAQGMGEQAAAVHANWTEQDFVQQVLDAGAKAERVVIANVGDRRPPAMGCATLIRSPRNWVSIAGWPCSADARSKPGRSVWSASARP
jgi:hypothetical protein